MSPEAAVEQLLALVPIPDQPVRPREIDWAAFASENGFPAPADYRLLLEAYGVGSFGTSETPAGGWLYLLDPFEPGRTLVDRSDWERRNATGLQRQFPDQYPGWPMWPQPGGLLPWGNTIDGDVVGWWTRGVPDGWGTRFFGRGDEFEEFRYGIAEFVLRLYRGELDALGPRRADASTGARRVCAVPPSAPSRRDDPRGAPRGGDGHLRRRHGDRRTRGHASAAGDLQRAGRRRDARADGGVPASLGRMESSRGRDLRAVGGGGQAARIPAPQLGLLDLRTRRAAVPHARVLLRVGGGTRRSSARSSTSPSGCVSASQRCATSSTT